jgi:L-ascorbate metabolism protein UlaG (beta-lactamase superfamily)
MKLTYFGHSAFQIETNTVTILIDPFITGNKHAKGKVTPEELNPDFIFLTHAHGDHWGDTPAIAKRTGAMVVGNFEVTSYLTKKHGHENVHQMNTGGSWRFDWGTVTQTYARHSSSFPDGTYGGNPNGYIFRIEDKTIYDLGDTCPFAEMEWVGEDLEVDVALMPVGDNFTMGANDAVRAARMIKPALTIPIHYNTFPPIEIDITVWERLMKEAGFKTRVLAARETLDV